MKKLIILLVIFVFGCNKLKPNPSDKKFNELHSPVIVFAKSKKQSVGSKAFIILIDSTNQITTFKGQNALGRSLMDTYKVGDTIIYNRKHYE